MAKQYSIHYVNSHKLFREILTLIVCLIVPAAGAAYDNISLDELPGGPPNAPADFSFNRTDNTFEVNYNGRKIIEGTLSDDASMTSSSTKGEIVEQRIQVNTNTQINLNATIFAGREALAAETSGYAQKTFPIVRTTHGLSRNLRNNAVYDRTSDWMIEMPAGKTRITPRRNNDGTTQFSIKINTSSFEIIFRPRYYQKHKNIKYYQPWTYQVRKDSITGWCSWWAYMRNFRQQHLGELLSIWQEKKFADYGYRFIQIDDVFQGEKDKGRPNAPRNNGYQGGRPETWLEWKKDMFPNGMTGYIDLVNKAGFEPAVWIGCFFSDELTVAQHPQWFVQDADGKPFPAEWASYTIDATKPEAANNLVKPTYRGLHNAGFTYVKIDQLRHMLYDNLHQNQNYCSKRGLAPDQIFRSYLKTARQEMGNHTFILSCWGVLPESVGIADACRIGGDGYGPVTMQQYNSWNGIVWRNDPDHCDIYPRFKPAEKGNVIKKQQVTAVNNDTIIRPALASIAGCMLMLSDRPEIYKDDRNLVGARRSSPVLFSVPGQLYDFDNRKTEKLRKMKRSEITSGRGPSPIDGDQLGDICPWWLNEIDVDFDHWNVLHRLNWSNTSSSQTVIKFSEIGLDPNKEYIVYEFWSNKLIAVTKDSVRLPDIDAMGLHSFAIREKLDRPQLISTNRHLSHGAVDIETMTWSTLKVLSGRSRVISQDRYSITLFLPNGSKITKATFDDKPASITYQGQTVTVSFIPTQTASIGWIVEF
jgi:hypothetical protein